MLRRLLPAAALALCLCPALAQTQKGQSFYTGTFSFSRTTQTQLNSLNDVSLYRSSDIDLAARAGFFVKDNFALGLGLSQQWRGSNDAGLAVRPFVRWYRPLGERFSGFLQAEARYRITGGESRSLGEPRFGLNGGLGLVYFASKRLAIEASTNLLSLNVARTHNSAVRGTSGNAGVNLNANALTLGLAYYVGANPSRRTPNAENALVRGTRFLGGGFDLSGNTRNVGGWGSQNYSVYSNGFNIGVRPEMGWFVRDNVAVGLGVGVGVGRAESDTRAPGSTLGGEPYSVRNELSLGIRPFVRHYAMLGPKVGVFLETSLNVGYARQNHEFGDSNGSVARLDYNSFFLQAGLRPGITYFLGRRFAVEATTGFVGFNLSNNRYPAITSQGVRELKNNSFSFSPTWTVGSDVGVGLKYFIR